MPARPPSVSPPSRRRLSLPAASGLALALALTVLVATTPPAGAQGQTLLEAALDEDRLGLIASPDPTGAPTLGREIWEVWTCRTGGLRRLSPRSAATTLNLRLTPYFEWLSDGKYQPVFQEGGSVTAVWGQTCEEQAAAAGRKPGRHALIVDDRAAAMFEPPSPFFADEGAGGAAAAATITVNGEAMDSLSDASNPAPGPVAHRLGHALGFPHSYGGGTVSGAGASEYDNPMDVMSGGAENPLPVGTIAVNRYAAGWIESGGTAVHRSGAAAYQLSPVGEDGFQMLVIPSRDGPGAFYALGVRVRERYDRGIPKEGVEVYFVDQRPTACAEPVGGACRGGERRTRQEPAGERAGLLRHVHREGEAFDVGGVRVEVAERSGNRFTVRVGTPRPGEVARLVCGTRFAGRFCDEDGSVHERAIENAAEWGITVGCGEARFCPDETITRRQMAAFLYRAVRWTYGTPGAPGGQTSLADVPFNAWYRPFAEWAVAAQVMSAPSGVFDPGRLVTRWEMAEMLVAAFEYLSAAPSAERVFEDMAGYPVGTVWAAEALYEAGVAKGCSTHPRGFCPERPVTRAQMASFLVRALGA